MAAVPRVNLKIPQGTTYVHEFNYVEQDGTTIIDITGYSARLQFRETKESATYFYEALSGGALTIDGAAGKITLQLTDTLSTAFTIYTGFYDLEIISGSGAVTRIVEGKISISREVTR